MTVHKGFGAIGVFVWIATLAAGYAAHAMEFPADVPTAVVHSQDFAGVHGLPNPWQVSLGTWHADGQTYDSVVAARAAVTTIFEYQTFDFGGPSTTDTLPWPEYTLAARLRNQQSGAAALAGLVYSYVDPSNYSEVAFSATGVAYLRRMFRGEMQTLAAATYAGGGPRVWFVAALTRAGNSVSVSVNGVPVFTEAEQFGGGGQVGLSTYNTTAKFNKVEITFPFGQQPFTETFSDGIANDFFSPEGTFVVSNGTYVDTAVHKIGTAYPPVAFAQGSQGVYSYTVRVRMLNPYGGAGNLVGILFDQLSETNYHEVVFLPTGFVQIRHVNGSTIDVVKSVPYPVPRNAWFQVTMDLGAGVTVNINGNHVFTEQVPLLTGKPEALALITHWTPGRFDDFKFGYDPPVRDVVQTFNSPLGSNEVQSGTWNTQGGTLNNVSAGIADIALPGLIGASNDYSFKGRLLNQYGASGNLVGLVFSYRSPEDYFEAVFSPTGQAYLNLVIEGTRYRLASGAHAVPKNVAFDVEIIRKGTTATVIVNGKPMFQNVQVGQLGGGVLGVVSHWAKGRWDNLVTKEVL